MTTAAPPAPPVAAADAATDARWQAQEWRRKVAGGVRLESGTAAEKAGSTNGTEAARAA
jgi:hypothetical protein